MAEYATAALHHRLARSILPKCFSRIPALMAGAPSAGRQRSGGAAGRHEAVGREARAMADDFKILARRRTPGPRPAPPNEEARGPRRRKVTNADPQILAQAFPASSLSRPFRRSTPKWEIWRAAGGRKLSVLRLTSIITPSSRMLLSARGCAWSRDRQSGSGHCRPS